jgi:hypothetical protein
VPAGATTGPIEVVTQAGRALGPVFAIVHGRDVTMQARGDGQTISGALHVEDGFAACLRNQQVKVQRRGHAGRWRTIRNTMSRADGSYRAQLPDLPGAYRVRLPRATLGSGDICGRGKSPVRHL